MCCLIMVYYVADCWRQVDITRSNASGHAANVHDVNAFKSFTMVFLLQVLSLAMHVHLLVTLFIHYELGTACLFRSSSCVKAQ